MVEVITKNNITESPETRSMQMAVLALNANAIHLHVLLCIHLIKSCSKKWCKMHIETVQILERIKKISSKLRKQQSKFATRVCFPLN